MVEARRFQSRSIGRGSRYGGVILLSMRERARVCKFSLAGIVAIEQRRRRAIGGVGTFTGRLRGVF
jgi:hypothetical protein